MKSLKGIWTDDGAMGLNRLKTSTDTTTNSRISAMFLYIAFTEEDLLNLGVFRF
jgi:hypothetical protein